MSHLFFYCNGRVRSYSWKLIFKDGGSKFCMPLYTIFKRDLVLEHLASVYPNPYVAFESKVQFDNIYSPQILVFGKLQLVAARLRKTLI